MEPWHSQQVCAAASIKVAAMNDEDPKSVPIGWERAYAQIPWGKKISPGQLGILGVIFERVGECQGSSRHELFSSAALRK
eukprot:1161912-Pelagomonas_calceolata.AAC.5